ncbi:hypothetical protein [Bradyrhizobium valentinum]|nr:hypothetical protein [Bradyrhizobium valentinum]
MTKSVLLGAAALLSAMAATPVMAQEVIHNPGHCAQFYPNANCQNKGPNNPYTGDYQRRNQIRGAYAWSAKAASDVSQSTDFSSRGRHYRHHRMHHHSGHKHYRSHYGSYGYAPRPYYRSYGYAPRPHYRSYGGYAPQRYYGVAGPGISFGFGGGGYRGW